jgi:hypothetical protein
MSLTFICPGSLTEKQTTPWGPYAILFGGSSYAHRSFPFNRAASCGVAIKPRDSACEFTLEDSFNFELRETHPAK